jgi:hypothetical protein
MNAAVSRLNTSVRHFAVGGESGSHDTMLNNPVYSKSGAVPIRTAIASSTEMCAAMNGSATSHVESAAAANSRSVCPSLIVFEAANPPISA